MRLPVLGFIGVLLTVGVPLVAEANTAELIKTSCAGHENYQLLTLTEAVIQSLSNEPHLNLARQDVEESKADVTSAKTPFLPKGQLILDDERFVPNGTSAPVTVVGNNILGGTRTYSAYGSISISWNVLNSGRDVAGYRAAQAELRSTTAALYSQLDDTLSGLLKAYAEVYETRLSVDQKGLALERLRMIEERSNERFRHGDGTTIAIGQAREAALDAEQSFNQACSSLTDKSLALAKAMGARLPLGQLLLAGSALPEISAAVMDSSNSQTAIENDPAVISAKEKVAEAEALLRQAHAAFGPSVSIDARRDYLGQNVDSLTNANRMIAPNSYRVGISLIQPIFSFTTESSAIAKARAELRKAQVSTEQARSEVDAKLRSAVAVQAEADASYRAALKGVTEAQKILDLTQSLRRAGRTDLDNLEHAELDLEKSQVQLQTLASHRVLANWDVARAFYAILFAHTLLRDIGVELNVAFPD